eukprot:9133174-Karenia_brevis.AAC.1
MTMQSGAPGQSKQQQKQQQQPRTQSQLARTQPLAATRPAVIPSQERKRKRAFQGLYDGVRKVELYNKEMGSISDLLSDMATPAAKRAKPTIGQKLPGWAIRFGWPAHSWTKTPRLASKT